MNSKTLNRLRQTLLPVIAAAIWGTAFVAQSVSTDIVEPFTFNASRSAIAVLFLGLTVLMLRCFRKKADVSPEEKTKYRKNLWFGGILSGIMLSIATNLQQAGLADTDPGKAAFITALYIVLVPIFGIFLRKKIPLKVILALAVAVAGLYLLCIKSDFSIQISDILILACAVAFAWQIIVIDIFGSRVNGIEFSFVQFLTTAVISSCCAFIFESPNMAALVECAVPILYVGIFSSGVAYTLQIIAQKDANPTLVSLLLSLESVFGVISSAIILNSTLSVREYIGCVLMLVAVVFAQLPSKKKLS
ncbi:MAG: DMT family transporter [Ruminococcaceae bacterium]|nr:DMT family transporter [Oscillospiraceae bacterium]